MRIGKVLSGGLLLAVLSVTACMNVPNDMTVAEYCANPKKANENVCRLKVEIDGTSTALASTDMRLADALKLTANAQATADAAQADAAAAMARAEEAYAKDDSMVCETTTVQKSTTGSCREGYTLTSCNQTRYTYRAGGPSILREINDKQCRFNDRVLEMQVRCCGTASSVPQPADLVVDGQEAETVETSAPAPEAEVTPAPVSP
ncbi:hypothetical protein [Hyphomonas sp.]|jgi:hypothetical protein|uniref:hypothetical protein n=1 Tax=Hyphomonas sp. TaxID=87 RepID=UPI0025C48E27|nr:hypothetical protein [Hyphomonas sp.]